MYPCRNRKCGYSTNIITNFNDHSRTHTNQRISSCDVCEAEFSRGSSMIKHKKIIHTSNKEIKCLYCTPTSFDKLRYLTRHIRKVHNGVETYICKYKKCNEMFPTLTALTFHENIKHNDVIINLKKIYINVNIVLIQQIIHLVGKTTIIHILVYVHLLAKFVLQNLQQTQIKQNIRKFIH